MLGEGKGENDLQHQLDLSQIPLLPFSGCASLDKFLYFSEPQCVDLNIGNSQ